MAARQRSLHFDVNGVEVSRFKARRASIRKQKVLVHGAAVEY
jgi:hypothetical protein